MELVWTIFYVIFLGIVSHFYGQALPRKWFKADKFPYRNFAFEREGKVYRNIGVHKWQKKMPDMSQVMPDMVTKGLTPGMSADEVRTLIAETCVAEHVHVVLCISFLYIAKFWDSHVWIYLWLLYTVCNIPFIIIQRYNRPKLLRVLSRLERKEKKSEGHSVELL